MDLAAEYADRAVYLPAVDAVVCADLHVGRAAASAVEFPIGEREDLTGRFGALLERFDPAVAVLAGDLLHSFDRVPTGAAATVRSLAGIAEEAGIRTIVLRGNHDTMLGELWDGRIDAERDLGDGIVVAHGHVPPETDAEWYVVGHDHPTIEIEGDRRPCYLYGPDQYRGAGLLMLPTFSRLPAGVRVNSMSAAAFQSPLVTDAGALRPVVHDTAAGETYEFPPLSELRQHL
jgi:metallophosphoesterase superfamily enzyme